MKHPVDEPYAPKSLCLILILVLKKKIPWNMVSIVPKKNHGT
jgi:hypothetical protein